MTPRARRLVALVTLGLALVVVLVLTLRAFGVPLALGPAASPTPLPSTASPDPSVSGSPSLEEALTALEAEVADIRDLPPAPIGPAEFISREELEERLAAEFEAEYPADEIAADNAMYRALGLLSRDQDIADLQLQLLSSQVLGYYDDEAQAMVVVADAELTPETQVVYVHEYVHALQDAAFGIDSLPLDGGDDAAFAALSLLEGDATTAMVLWAYQNLSPEDILEISQTPLPDTTGVPAWMVTQLGFPYLDGTDFTSQLFARGGFAAVDEAWTDPPGSTEQILHFDTYVDDEVPLDRPVEVDAPPDADVVRTATFGEAMIAIWFGALGVDQTDADQAAAGWGGDALSVIVANDGQDVAIALDVAWDAPLDATEFAAAYEDALARTDLFGRLVELSETEQFVVQGTSQELVESIAPFGLVHCPDCGTERAAWRGSRPPG
jgi:hypothetical protein